MVEDVRRGRNHQLYDLGLDPGDMFENDQVKSKIVSLDEEFHQVLLLEHLDESLVMMAENLCWSLHQVCLKYFLKLFDERSSLKVRYVQLNARKEMFVTKLTEESRDILTDWLWADYLLYKYFLETHKLKVREFGADRMKTGVNYLQTLNTDLRKQCIVSNSTESRRVERIFKSSSKKVMQVIPNKYKRWCTAFFKTEIAFTRSIRLMNRLEVRNNNKLKIRNRKEKNVGRRKKLTNKKQDNNTQ